MLLQLAMQDIGQVTDFAPRRSMAAVAARRKDEWLALFTPDATVQDPVGPSRLDPDRAMATLTG
jgi:hypothetical protein